MDEFQDFSEPLADAIMALINAKPSSPTKAEVMAEIEHALIKILRMSIDAGMLASYPRFGEPSEAR